MTTVLSALDSNASAHPVLTTSIALASIIDATVIALHVRENAPSTAADLARAAGVELREVDGVPVEQIVAAARHSEVAARGCPPVMPCATEDARTRVFAGGSAERRDQRRGWMRLRSDAGGW